MDYRDQAGQQATRRTPVRDPAAAWARSGDPVSYAEPHRDQQASGHPSVTGWWDPVTDPGGFRGGQPREDHESHPPYRYGGQPAGEYDEPWAGARLDSGSDGFWSGTRLAGDDPRWMATPASAPRSPAVGYPDPSAGQPDPAPRHRAAESSTADSFFNTWFTGPDETGSGTAVPDIDRSSATVAAVPRPRRGGSPAARTGTTGSHRAVPAADGSRQVNRPGTATSQPAVLRVVLWTAGCYLVPLLAFVGWVLTLSTSAPGNCLTDAAGGGCESPQARAMVSLSTGLPQFGAALLVSLLVAVLLRRMAGVWRSGSVGLASAVIGGGLATILLSVVSGQPLG